MIRLIKGLYHFVIGIVALVWFRFPSRELTVIGVTGTDGKTTTVTLIYEILKAAKLKASMISSVHAVIAGKSYDTGFHVTTPNAWYIQKYLREAADHHDQYVVLEVTSHGISQSRVLGIDFAVGVITNVTPEHLDWHKTFEKYLATKIKLLLWAKTAIVNRDEAVVYNEASKVLRRKNFITYGIRREAQYTPKTYPFKTKLPGLFNRYNCLAAIAAADSLGIPKKYVRAAVSEFKGVTGRMEVVAEKPFKVIVDFAHTPNALDKALKTVRHMCKGKLIHVFGSAGLRDKLKRPKMGEVSAIYADMIVLTEEDYRTEDVNAIIDQIASGIPQDKIFYRYPDRREAINFALNQAQDKDIVLITGKGHERSLCRGTVEYPWSDQEAVKTGIKHLQNK